MVKLHTSSVLYVLVQVKVCKNKTNNVLFTKVCNFPRQNMTVKAAFQLRVFSTCVYARKSSNLSKFYSSTNYLDEYTLNHTSSCMLSFYATSNFIRKS